MISQERLLELIRGLPEVRLELLDLAWDLHGEDGKPDPQKIAFHYTELEKAIGEAETYTRATREMVGCLINLIR